MSERMAALANPADASMAYLQGQMRPSQGPLLDAYARESEATIAACDPVLDIPYGPHPRELFDLFVSPWPWRATLAYFHAGYWQSRDKAQFRFLAPAFLAHGIDVVLVNYPLCPDVTLSRLVEAARRSIPAILSHVGGMARGGASLVAAGHSAGGHLAVELAMTDWTSRGLADAPVSGIIAISGVYELAPLLATKLNDKLRLDRDDVHALSPLHHVRGTLPPAIFAVGDLETPAFHAQSEAMHAAWQSGGGASSLRAVTDADHFSVLRALAADGALWPSVMALIDASQTIRP